MNWDVIKTPIKLIVGWILFIVGLITAPLPLPIGQFIALIGLSLLVSESHFMRVGMQKVRRKFPFICKQMNKAYPYLPKFLKKVIDHTDPMHLDL